jgi:serine/threonine protein kinase
MSNKLSGESFLTVVQKSNLVDPERLEKLVDEYRLSHAGSVDALPLAEFLVQRQALTRWQAEKLLLGKHKGYFLGKYRLLSLLGKGGMSSVYLAEHVLMKRRCAIKVLPAKRVGDTSYLARFHREAQAVASLDHPNIVRAYDVDHQADRDSEIHFLVMEYVEGQSLQELVARQGVVPFRAAADYARQAAIGLEHAHRAGLVHRDIKPGNLLLDLNGTVKILDLGLARFFDNQGQDQALTIQHDEKVLGTADYLAPEQALDSHRVDARADLYSLGCTLYFLLSGHPPFTEGTLAQRLMAHQTKEPSAIEAERPGVPAGLVAILHKMMAKQPDQRYPSAAALADALQDWLNSTDADESPTAVTSPTAASRTAAGDVAIGVSGGVELGAAPSTRVVNSQPSPAAVALPQTTATPGPVPEKPTPKPAAPQVASGAVPIAKPVSSGSVPVVTPVVPGAVAAAAGAVTSTGSGSKPPVAAPVVAKAVAKPVAPVAGTHAGVPPAVTAQPVAASGAPTVTQATTARPPVAKAVAKPVAKPVSQPIVTAPIATTVSRAETADVAPVTTGPVSPPPTAATPAAGVTPSATPAASGMPDFSFLSAGDSNETSFATSSADAEENVFTWQPTDSAANSETEVPSTSPGAPSATTGGDGDASTFTVNDAAHVNHDNPAGGHEQADLSAEAATSSEAAPDTESTEASAGPSSAMPDFSFLGGAMNDQSESVGSFESASPTAEEPAVEALPMFDVNATPSITPSITPQSSPATHAVPATASSKAGPSTAKPVAKPHSSPAPVTPMSFDMVSENPAAESEAAAIEFATGSDVNLVSGVALGGPVVSRGSASVGGRGASTQTSTAAPPNSAAKSKTSTTNISGKKSLWQQPVVLAAGGGGVLLVGLLLAGLGLGWFGGGSSVDKNAGETTGKSVAGKKSKSSSATTADGSDSSATTAGAWSNKREATVGMPGDFPTVTAALEVLRTQFEPKVRSDRFVLKLAPGTYTDRWSFSAKASPENITIQGGPGVKLAPSGADPVISVTDIERIEIRGVSVSAEGKPVAIRLAGGLAGCRLQDVSLTGVGQTGIELQGALGLSLDEMRLILENVQIRGSGTAVGIRAVSSDVDCGNVQLLRCRLIGPLAAGVSLSGADLANVEFRECLFHGLGRGVSFEPKASWRDVVLVQNTFHECGVGVAVAVQPPPTSKGFSVRRNLFVKSTQADIQVAQEFNLEQLSEKQMLGLLTENWSDRAVPTTPGNELPIYNSGRPGVTDLAFGSTSPDDPHFLVPAEGQAVLSAMPATRPDERPWIGALGR